MGHEAGTGGRCIAPTFALASARVAGLWSLSVHTDSVSHGDEFRDGEWVELLWLTYPKDQSLDPRLVAVQLAIRGFDTERNTNPRDIQIATPRTSAPDASTRVSVRKSALKNRREPVATRMPLQNLRRPGSAHELQRQRDLGTDDIKELLRGGPLAFVCADVGLPTAWLDPSRTFDVWTLEVRSHLVAPNEAIDLDAFPDGYCYAASLWTDSEGIVILLEKHH